MILTHMFERNAALVRAKHQKKGWFVLRRPYVRRRVAAMLGTVGMLAAITMCLRDAGVATTLVTPHGPRLRLVRVPCGGEPAPVMAHHHQRHTTNGHHLDTQRQVHRRDRRVVSWECATAATVDAGTCVEEPVGSFSRGWLGSLWRAIVGGGSSPRVSGSSGRARGRRRRQWTRRVRCLPSVLIAGAQKSATGSLSDWLSSHPLVRRGTGATPEYGGESHPVQK
mmetsp:Transcript_16577/g.66903  ORF Transcript_16577/g.66903 Transcript_16577/m.66903 type:complete len:224 (+) Transcript_16577:62-733(+)